MHNKVEKKICEINKETKVIEICLYKEIKSNLTKLQINK